MGCAAALHRCLSRLVSTEPWKRCGHPMTTLGAPWGRGKLPSTRRTGRNASARSASARSTIARAAIQQNTSTARVLTPGFPRTGARAGRSPCRMSKRVCGRTPLRPHGRRLRESCSTASQEHADPARSALRRARRRDDLVCWAARARCALDRRAGVREGHRERVRVGNLCDGGRPRCSGRLSRARRVQSRLTQIPEPAAVSAAVEPEASDHASFAEPSGSARTLSAASRHVSFSRG